MEVINKLLEKNISKTTFALVDKTVPVDQKGELSDIISSTTRPHHFPPGKPVFPGPKFVDLVALWPESGELPRVAKLAGEKSWLVFHQLKMSGQDMMWLNEEVENWTRRIQ